MRVHARMAALCSLLPPPGSRELSSTCARCAVKAYAATRSESRAWTAQHRTRTPPLSGKGGPRVDQTPTNTHRQGAADHSLKEILVQPGKGRRSAQSITKTSRIDR